MWDFNCLAGLYFASVALCGLRLTARRFRHLIVSTGLGSRIQALSGGCGVLSVNSRSNQPDFAS